MTMTHDGSTTTNAHPVVSRGEWLAARTAFLAKEKEFTRLRDDLSRQRRELPWTRVDKPYVFDGPGGEATLADLFANRSQLVVYHFMFGPDWEEGCPYCSFWADTFNGIGVHLNQRDVTFVVISRASLAEIERFKQRMGWGFTWVSSGRTDFSEDFDVSYTPEQIQRGAASYNYASIDPGRTNYPGVSVFYKGARGRIFHTYSCYARGLDLLNATYNYLDLVPKGRNEASLKFPVEWVRHHDRYAD